MARRSGKAGTQLASKPAHQNFRQLRSRNRRDFSQILESVDLLTGVWVSSEGRVELECTTWKEYWNRVTIPFVEGLPSRLVALGRSRIAYIKSRFALKYALPYCRDYFLFLHAAISLVGHGGDQAILQAILSLESAALGWNAQSIPLAAVTNTMRNPAYLLAKMRQPHA